MPTTLITERFGNKNLYTRIDTDIYGKEVLHRTSSYDVVQCFVDGRTTFSLLDENGRTNSLFNNYINKTMVEDRRSVNSRRKNAEVLAKFYSFLDLMGYSESILGYNEIMQLRTFFQGNGKTGCKNDTVNAYLSIVRDFFKKNKINCEALFSQHIVQSRNDNDFRDTNVFYAYDTNLPVNPHKNERVPKYVSFNDYIRLIQIAQGKGDWNGVMLMHLMYRYGMRLGECLGLTEEDFVYKRIKGEDVPTLILRNRLSDESWQHAKRRIIPYQPLDYSKKEYIEQWRDDDFSHIYLTESGDFVVVFKKFLVQGRENAEQNSPDNYKSCEADVVCPSEFKLDKNHYIFVNRLGKRLSAQLWGHTLRQYFIEAGIPVDREVKSNNLSHRFRHGFAMARVRDLDPPMPLHILQKEMRHACISSTMIYLNPTIEDEFNYKTKMQKQLYDRNPELQKVLNNYLNYE